MAKYRVQYLFRPGAGVRPADWRDYVPPTNMSEVAAYDLTDRLRAKYQTFTWRYMPWHPPKTTRNELVHTAGVLARAAASSDVVLTKLAKLDEQGAKLACQALWRRAQWDRSSRPLNAAIRQDNQGRLVIRMGGAR